MALASNLIHMSALCFEQDLIPKLHFIQLFSVYIWGKKTKQKGLCSLPVDILVFVQCKTMQSLKIKQFRL